MITNPEHSRQLVHLQPSSRRVCTGTQAKTQDKDTRTRTSPRSFVKGKKKSQLRTVHVNMNMGIGLVPAHLPGARLQGMKPQTSSTLPKKTEHSAPTWAQSLCSKLGTSPRRLAPESSWGGHCLQGGTLESSQETPCWWRQRAWCDAASPTPLIFGVFGTVRGVNFGHPHFPCQPPLPWLWCWNPAWDPQLTTSQQGRLPTCRAISPPNPFLFSLLFPRRCIILGLFVLSLFQWWKPPETHSGEARTKYNFFTS